MDNQKIIEKKYLEAVQGIREEWLESGGSRWYDYIVNLPIPLQLTYMIVVLHNQVLNGGFHQYFVNGYGQFAYKTVDHLNAIKAARLSELLRKAILIVNKDNIGEIKFRENLLRKDIPELFEGEDMVAPLDELDQQYYRWSESIEQLLAEYLVKYNSTR